MTDERYREMWEKLNLDLTAHDGLLEVLGKFYGDIYVPGGPPQGDGIP